MKKEVWTFKDLEEIIDNRTEESIELDFKSAGSFDKADNKKKIEISKDVSAFSNSIGGLIIYGIREKDHVAEEFSFIDGNLYTKEWLEQIINSGIHPRIENIIIHPIRKDKDIAKTVYIVEIPESSKSPHMAKDCRYYRRYNFESIPMEHYEVVRLLHKEKTTVLEIISEEIGITSHPDFPFDIGVSLSIQIKNIGDIIEKYYKLQIELPSIELLPTSSSHSMIHTNYRKGYFVYSSNNTLPLFQNEEISIGDVFYDFKKHDIELINKELDIIVTLYYSSGKKEKIIKLSKLYTEAINMGFKRPI